jgi:hypothetical protein
LRREEDRDRLQVQVGPVDVDFVTIAISDTDDPSNAHFSRAIPTRATGDAELELDRNELPQSLEDLAGDHVFVDSGNGFVAVGQVPALPAAPSGCSEDGGNSGSDGDSNDSNDDDQSDGGATEVRAECDRQEARFEFDVELNDGDADVEDGHIRVRSDDGRNRLQVEIGPLPVGLPVTFLIQDGGSTVFERTLNVRADGDAELELDNAPLDDLVGLDVLVDIGNGPVLLGQVPSLDCNN